MTARTVTADVVDRIEQKIFGTNTSRNANAERYFPLRDALDELNEITSALRCVSDLLIPAEQLDNVDRNDLSMLLSVIRRAQVRETPKEERRDSPDWQGMASAAIFAVGDLITPETNMHLVSREDLCALLDLLTHLHQRATEAAWKGMNGLIQ